MLKLGGLGSLLAPGSHATPPRARTGTSSPPTTTPPHSSPPTPPPPPPTPPPLPSEVAFSANLALKASPRM